MPISLLWMAFHITHLTAQELPNIVPNSPEAEEFIKYGNTALNMYTGRPNISIPLYTVQGREFNLPISLDYDAGGIRVSQIATQVGLAWSLQAGGVISRVTNGKPDHVIGPAAKYYDSYYTYYNELDAFYGTNPTPIPWDWDVNSGTPYQPISPAYLPSLVDYFLLEEQIFKGEIDTQPDYFSFNIGGMSGTIYIDPVTGEAHCDNGMDYDISYSGSLTNFEGGGITSWHIIDEKGNQYFFGRYDTTNIFIDSSGEDDRKKYISSWQLTRIISANGKDTIDFHYDYADFWTTEKYTPKTTGSQSYLLYQSPHRSSCATTSNYDASTVTPYQIAQHYLSSIELNNREVVSFHRSTTERKDLSARYALERISLANGIDWELHQSYFKSDPSIDIDHITPITQDDIRLKLDSITKRPYMENKRQTYSFDYFNPENVPNQQSFAQDYWGFYNGRSGNTGLIPEETILVQDGQGSSTDDIRNLPGADRTPNLSFCKNGTLSRITYPTGGRTEFKYGLHDIKTTESSVELNNMVLGSLIGGNDPLDPYDYWDDEYFNDNPKGGEFVVPIYSSGTRDIRISYSAPSFPHGPGDNDDGVLYVALLRCDGEEIPVADDCGDIPQIFESECPQDLDWYDIENYTPSKRMFNKTYFGGSSPIALNDGYSESISVSLAPGFYKLYILNGVTNSNLSVTMAYPASVLTNNFAKKVGGLRVDRVEDYAFNGTAPDMVKEYTYSQNGIDNCGDSYTYSSGKLHFDPIFSYYSYYEDALFGTSNYCSFLERFPQPLNASQSPHVAYSMVTETSLDGDGASIGRTDHYFYNSVEENHLDGLYPPFLKSNHLNGKVQKVLVFDNLGALKRQTVNAYHQTQVENSIQGLISARGTSRNDDQLQVFGQEVFKLKPPAIDVGGGVFYAYGGDPTPVMTVGPPNFDNKLHYRYTVTNNYPHLDNTRVTDYFGSDSLVTTTDHYYDGLTVFPRTHRNISRTLFTGSDGKTLETRNYYPADVKNSGSLGYDVLGIDEMEAVDLMMAANRTTEPLQTETRIDGPDGIPLSNIAQRTNYRNWYGNTVLPEVVETLTGTNDLEARIRYHRFDNRGNPLEVSKANGSHISYVWGYNQEYPIAKLENFSDTDLDPIQLGLFSAARSASDLDNDRTMDTYGPNGERNYNGKEGMLREALDHLREEFPDALITTYTYDPLIGVTSITDPRGYTIYYHYDEYNRLKEVRDSGNNLVTDYEYHHKAN